MLRFKAMQLQQTIALPHTHMHRANNGTNHAASATETTLVDSETSGRGEM